MSGHEPVLLNEVLTAIGPKDGQIYIDGTFGGGGYSGALLSQANCNVIGIDRDPTIKERTKHWREQFGTRLMLLEGNFGDMVALLDKVGIKSVDGITLDLGVSSFQLDDPERGFSFQKDGPLDMRMSTSGLSASTIINEYEERELADIIYNFGEERYARRIARAIMVSRKKHPITRTGQLAEIIRNCFPRRFGHSGQRIDPATRTFQAIRIHVNDELGELERGLKAAEQILNDGGRIAIVSFHSLEDRFVKSFLGERSLSSSGTSRHLPEKNYQSKPSFTLISRRPVRPSSIEIERNPRARSARLRVARRTSDFPRPGNVLQ